MCQEVSTGGFSSEDFGTLSAVRRMPDRQTTITASTAAHIADIVDVTVTNPDQTTATLPKAFTFIGPPKRVRGQITSQ